MPFLPPISFSLLKALKGESNIKDKDGNIIKNLLLDYDEGIPVGIYNEKKIKPLDY